MVGHFPFVRCARRDKNWNCKCSSRLRIVSQKSGVEDYKRGKLTEENIFNCESNCWGYNNFISFSELMDPSNGFYNKSEDKVTLAIDFTVN
ncbi:hypothetical protein niasHS_004518 [Heterodera schachtii]|uniref:MATH domain-containing protein n=1 Tax=Heterodera schachtii TaxID=97005 RepID=A0ABD2JMF3_HETSC